MTGWRDVGKLNGYVDVEIQAPLRLDRDELVQRAASRLGIRPGARPWSRTRVTNLTHGQWHVRFYK